MSKGEGGGQITINVEQKGGHGAIEVYLASDDKRIAVAEGQCTGPESCNASITVDRASAADGIKVVWSAKNLGPKDYYMASAYTCSPGSTGCTSNRIEWMQQKVAGTQAKATFKVDTTNGSITIGGSFSVDKPAGGVNYCMQEHGSGTGLLKEGDVIGSAACQATMNDWAASCGLGAPQADGTECSGDAYAALTFSESGSCGEDISGAFGDFCAAEGGLGLKDW